MYSCVETVLICLTLYSNVHDSKKIVFSFRTIVKVIINQSRMSDLNQKTKNSEVKWKMLLLGMTLAFVANLFFISNMFAVGKFELGSGELCFVKGIIQTIVFGLAAVPCISSILHKKRYCDFKMISLLRKNLSNLVLMLSKAIALINYNINYIYKLLGSQSILVKESVVFIFRFFQNISHETMILLQIFFILR